MFFDHQALQFFFKCVESLAVCHLVASCIGEFNADSLFVIEELSNANTDSRITMILWMFGISIEFFTFLDTVIKLNFIFFIADF